MLCFFFIFYGQHSQLLLHCIYQCMKHSYVLGDTTATSSGNDDHTISVVAGVMSLVIILISGVAAFVIILLILKIRRQSLAHK